MKYTLITLTLATLVAPGSTLRIIAQNEFGGFSRNSLTDEADANLATLDLVRLGYFELADGPTLDGDAFGSFVEIDTLLIDLGVLGNFSQTIDLDDIDDVPGTASQTLQFGIRFFNNSTIGGSTFFNTVTNEAWRFTFSPEGTNPPPTDSEMFLDPTAGGLTVGSAIWEGGAPSAFKTTVPVPEPSSSLTLLLGAGLLLSSRRRK
ncbi:MAG: hypothetical protein ACJA16_000201 [Akkermansiaceae bacterium]|jgi:hypothetical protein